MPNGIKILNTKNKSATATTIESTTVIGIVGTVLASDLDANTKAKLSDESLYKLLKFSNADDALEVFADHDGTIREDLRDIKSQNVKSPIIISVVELETDYKNQSPQDFYGSSKVKSSIITAIGNLRRSRTLFGDKIRVLVAGWFSNDETVRHSIESFVAGTKSIAIVDMNLDDVSKAEVELKKLGSDRTLVFPFYRRAYSTYENKTVFKPNSAVVAGHIAYWDAQLGEFGTCFDHANRAVYDVEGCKVALTYEEGEDTCEVNRIVNAGGALIINDDGYRLYNYETPSDDARFNKLETARFFDTLNENIQKSLKKHKHRPLTEVLHLAKADVDAFLQKAQSAGASVGSKVWWSDQNSATEISAGKLYLDYDAGNNVGVRTIVVQPYATNEYYSVETK
jgi:phage tail sheath protein FI